MKINAQPAKNEKGGQVKGISREPEIYQNESDDITPSVSNDRGFIDKIKSKILLVTIIYIYKVEYRILRKYII